MGTATSQQSLVDSSYQYLYTNPDQNYGEARVYRKKGSNDLVAIISRSGGPAENIQKKIRLLQNKQQIAHQNILSIYGCQKIEADDLCSRVSVIQMLVDFVPRTLQTDFKERKANFRCYQEEEIWYLIYALSSALYCLKNANSEYTDLHPTRVLLTDQGEVKIMDMQLLQDSMPNIAQVTMGLRETEYLAPEQLSSIRGTLNQVQNWESINVFNIGLMCAQLMTMSGMSEYYQENTNDYKINFKDLFESIKKSIQRNKYTPSLFDMINKLLHYTPIERPTYYDIIVSMEQIPPQNFAYISLTGQRLYQLISPRITQIQPENEASQVHYQSPDKNHEQEEEDDQNKIQQLLHMEKPEIPTEQQQQLQDSPNIYLQNLRESNQSAQNIQFVNEGKKFNPQNQVEDDSMKLLNIRIRDALMKSQEALNQYSTSQDRPKRSQPISQYDWFPQKDFQNKDPIQYKEPIASVPIVPLKTSYRRQYDQPIQQQTAYPTQSFQYKNFNQEQKKPFEPERQGEYDDDRINEIIRQAQQEIQKSIGLSRTQQY